jgi:hypothetical protein
MKGFVAYQYGSAPTEVLTVTQSMPSRAILRQLYRALRMIDRAAPINLAGVFETRAKAATAFSIGKDSELSF